LIVYDRWVLTGGRLRFQAAAQSLVQADQIRGNRAIADGPLILKRVQGSLGMIADGRTKISSCSPMKNINKAKKGANMRSFPESGVGLPEIKTDRWELRSIMRILTVSDYIEPILNDRSAAERLEQIDVIFSCGDLPPEYLSHLRRTFDAPLYYVRGNHDIRYSSSPPEGCENIHARLVQFRGLRILGLEGSRRYSRGPYQYTEFQMKRIIRRLRPRLWWHRGVDIILAHAPPRTHVTADSRVFSGLFASIRPAI